MLMVWNIWHLYFQKMLFKFLLLVWRAQSRTRLHIQAHTHAHKEAQTRAHTNIYAIKYQMYEDISRWILINFRKMIAFNVHPFGFMVRSIRLLQWFKHIDEEHIKPFDVAENVKPWIFAYTLPSYGVPLMVFHITIISNWLPSNRYFTSLLRFPRNFSMKHLLTFSSVLTCYFYLIES